ncbi:antA/AntB antirepressor family protein [Orrella sp. 11846]|uniref:antA/AntB antirepressor family protein n=1 Tax=Orrella sp. 11846 TaxID=3409913 RepID=UPI003B595526
MTGKSIGASAPTSLKPASDQSTVNHLRITIKNIARQSRNVTHLFIQCGMVAFPITLSGTKVPDYQIGDLLIAEYPKGNNSLNTEFSAIYPAHMKPEPVKEKKMLNNALPQDGIITISQGRIGDETIQTVDARELHAFLEVRSEFRNWIKNRINDFGFVENQDFTTIGKNLPTGGKQTDYFLTIEMAKELSMVERNEKGKQARLYFIECERRARTAVMSVPQNLPDALRLAADLAEENQTLALENQQKTEALAEAEPKLKALERISAGKTTLTITQASKVLGMKRTELTDWLAENGWVYRQNGSWVAYQRHIQNGRLKYKEAGYTDDETEMRVTRPYCHITRKGLALIAQALEIENY